MKLMLSKQWGIFRWFRPAILGLLALMFSSSLNPPARAEYTLQVDKTQNRGTWEGWGTSLAWWAHVVGGKNYQNLYADLFFTDKTVPFLGKQLPGLDLNIVRYNIGGGGRGEMNGTTQERVPRELNWDRDIDGYWINSASKDPSSTSWDWTRDAGQRAVLEAAIERGVNHVEFFSNAPMWWMNDSQSSAGGHLKSEFEREFAFYLATVIKHAQKEWGVRVNDISPFNEPSAGWWNYPKNQEGANIPRTQQKTVLGMPREELDKQKLKGVQITASDENSMPQALDTHEFFKTQTVQVGKQERNVADLVDKVNVHSYNGLAAWRDNKAREALRASVGTKRLWASELGGNDPSGMILAQTIMEDINFLRPTAWVYWQVLEAGSAWGLVNGHFKRTPDDPESGDPYQVYTEYYAMAQFTRFLKPGMRIIGSDDNHSVVAYNPRKRQLTFITINYNQLQRINYNLSSLQKVGKSAQLTLTNTDGSQLFQTSNLTVQDKKFSIEAPANSIFAVVVDGVVL